ncbi:MAG: AAA family ATPase, partial [Methyloprofundus sp.]|nr:AAA family ATPase [Methyloprofundus sp.]
MNKQALDPDLLYKPCNIEHFHFKDTSELEDIDIFLGQDRAIDSIQFGLRVDQRGYNIFALAPSGTGKLTTILQLVERESRQHPAPSDWCYINNFKEPVKPQAIKFSSGKGKEFQEDMEELIDELSVAIPAAFDGDEYRSKTEEIEEDYRQREAKEIEQLREEAISSHIILTETPTGYGFTPVDNEDNVFGPDKFNKLDK